MQNQRFTQTAGRNTYLLLTLLLSRLVVGVASAHDAGTSASSRVLPVPPQSGAQVASAPAGPRPATPDGFTRTNLPPLPAGVTELRFAEFYRQPIGPRGLEFSDKLRRLDGQRVRVLGYMVNQSQPVPRCFLLSPVPVTLHEEEYGFAEDMPATILHVFTDPGTPETVPFTPGLVLLTGKLSIGNRAEPDGRISAVRLQLDPPPPNEANKSARETSAVPPVEIPR